MNINAAMSFRTLYWLLPFSLYSLAYGPFTEDATVTETWSINSRTTVRISGCTITMKGRIDHSSGNPKLTISLAEGARFLLDAEAVVDNNMWDGINAKPLFFEGQSVAATFDHDVNFNADHTDYEPGKTSWNYDGMSSNYYANCTYISRHSRNLPTIHKLSGGGSLHTHHGLLNFEKPNSGEGAAKWIVTDNDQVYDGGIAWNTPLTLIAEKNITATGINHDAAKVHFGSLSQTGALLIKKGPATVYINATQAYNEGASMDIQEGAIAFGTDPGNPDDYQYPYKTRNPCQCLEVTVKENGAAKFLTGAELYEAHDNRYLPTVVRNGIKSLHADGEVVIGEGALEISGACAIGTSATTQFTHVTPATAVSVRGSLALDGALTIDAIHRSEPSHTLFQTQESLTGTFATTQLPQGVSITYESDKVILAIDQSVAISPSPCAAGRMSGYATRLRLLPRGQSLDKHQTIRDLHGRRIQKQASIQSTGLYIIEKKAP